MIQVEAFLLANNIVFVTHEHPPVFTCEELERYVIPGLSCKNLFLRDQKKKRYFLVILPAAKKTDLARVGEVVGERKLSFVNAESLKEKLGVEPGAVSPFGLLNDAAASVEVYVDREVHDAPLLHFHPNRNTASLELTREMFQKYISTVKNKVIIWDWIRFHPDSPAE